MFGTFEYFLMKVLLNFLLKYNFEGLLHLVNKVFLRCGIATFTQLKNLSTSSTTEHLHHWQKEAAKKKKRNIYMICDWIMK